MYGGWHKIVWPAEKVTIEAELLKQPGHPGFAPIREWRKDMGMDALKARTSMAIMKAAQMTERGEYPHIRSLSIGTPRVWAVGEVLTAANMNTFISDILDDLRGENGDIEFTDDITFESGHGYSIHDATGLTISTAAPAANAGANGDIWLERES